MPLTELQLKATLEKDKNIIVSAGAGSGKTTVLKNRVLRIIRNEKVSVTNLLILTFTNNAASEMRERIRAILAENEDTKKECDYIDTAYITTFDSYAGSLVRKYSHVLNIDKTFTLIDDNIISLETKRALDEIFESLYKNKDNYFERMILEYCFKNDSAVKESIIGIYNSLKNMPEYNLFLDNYIENFYNDNYINSSFDKYEENIFELHAEIVNLLENLSSETIKEEAIIKNNEVTTNFVNSTTYDEIRNSIFDRLAQGKNVYTEEGKEIKSQITELKKNLKAILIDDKKTLINHYKSTMPNMNVIINIIKELDKRVKEYKNRAGAYEFSDIALMAIKLVKDYEDVRNEVKNTFYEIMIDEYQDTSDIQETFVSYIANNNVYMVGDIKQSIYRFRNANPYIFKNKYDMYKEGNNGLKIDLTQNFRSRKEVVEGVNDLFTKIMTDEIGGCKYKEEHMMEYGNKAYLNYLLNDSYDMEIYEYNKDNSEYSPEEIEGFIIADDILKRINNKEMVINFDEKKERYADFKDFTILIDKSKNFEKLKKILESKNIPVSIYKDVDIKEDDEVYILKNILNLIVCINKKSFGSDFKHSFMSIARSYLFSYDDKYIFDIVINNKYRETDMYKICENLSKKLSSMSNKQILTNIVNDFKFNEKLLNVYDIKERFAKIEYFINQSENLNKFGFNPSNIAEFFSNAIKEGNSIKMNQKKAASNSVKIMTIHASKGLEFNYVYMPYLDSNFTKTPHKSLFSFSNKYGIMLPFYDHGLGNTFFNDLNKSLDRKEELSERIRLLYVALTRPKEKAIFIKNKSEKDKEINDLSKCTSYKDLLNYAKLSKYKKLIDLNEIEINKDYNKVKEFNFKQYIEHTEEKISVDEIKVSSFEKGRKHMSKTIKKRITKEERYIMDFGIRMHYLLEIIDFKNNNINSLDITNQEKQALTNFLNSDLLKNVENASIYKEKEIIYKKENQIYHGIIDLMLVYKNHVDIIDYKLSDTDNKEYKNQLEGYKYYIENIYQLPVNTYLYSINKGEFKSIK